MSETDTRFMALALALGRRGQGRTWPNPAVGCVIVNSGRIVGRGWTRPGGRPHAETEALAQAGDLARGATAYVSLEPCAHHGKSPPCAEALIKAGIARVVAPLEDPNPKVAGRGFAMLQEAGVKTLIGPCADAAARDHAGFFRQIRQQAPVVTLKLAASLDGRIATATGHSQWITGSGARRMVHGLRARHDAVMVGAGTARADDPALTIRDLGVDHQPVRIVVSRRIDIPLLSQMARTAKDVPVWLVHGHDADAERLRAWEGLGARLISTALIGSQVDPSDMLSQLGAAGLTRILCEGGGALAASLLASDLVDELVLFHAGIAIGAEGMPMIGALGLERLEDATRFQLAESRQIGPDLMQRWARAD